MSIAELPMPSTTTFLPSKIEGSMYSWAWSCWPLKLSEPGKAGSGQRASQWWPLATRTTSYSRTSPSSVLTV